MICGFVFMLKSIIFYLCDVYWLLLMFYNEIIIVSRWFINFLLENFHSENIVKSRKQNTMRQNMMILLNEITLFRGFVFMFQSQFFLLIVNCKYSIHKITIFSL
jgi:hypothetical protein